ncbi:hypothetical protein Pla100_53870 [Neorhodopirellula pilleata]|uniref:Uncharacterized protein n=1 Tax=Neorhodopirellula pilleata TaxID=2714738 RepID=A0A5C5ZY37_9BACT|nr:hypothetical protein Pla100_53870 [Neorhodopirellula pilleata]
MSLAIAFEHLYLSRRRRRQTVDHFLANVADRPEAFAQSSKGVFRKLSVDVRTAEAHLPFIGRYDGI